MASIFVLKRRDTNEYYQGSAKRNVDRRFDPSLKKAKKYKRSCDAANAATLMQQSHRAGWLNICGIFVIEEYGIALIGERVL